MGQNNSTYYHFGSVTETATNNYTVQVQPEYETFLHLSSIGGRPYPLRDGEIKTYWRIEAKNLENFIAVMNHSKEIVMAKGKTRQKFIKAPHEYEITPFEATCLLNLAYYLDLGDHKQYGQEDYRAFLVHCYHENRYHKPSPTEAYSATYLQLLTQYLTLRTGKEPKRGDLVYHLAPTMYYNHDANSCILLYDGGNWIYAEITSKPCDYLLLPRSFGTLAHLEFDPNHYTKLSSCVYNDPDNLRVIDSIQNNIMDPKTRDSMFLYKGQTIQINHAYQYELFSILVLLDYRERLIFFYYVHIDLINGFQLYRQFRNYRYLFVHKNDNITVSSMDPDTLEYLVEPIKNRVTESLAGKLIADVLGLCLEYI